MADEQGRYFIGHISGGSDESEPETKEAQDTADNNAAGQDPQTPDADEAVSGEAGKAEESPANAEEENKAAAPEETGSTAPGTGMPTPGAGTPAGTPGGFNGYPAGGSTGYTGYQNGNPVGYTGYPSGSGSEYAGYQAGNSDSYKGYQSGSTAGYGANGFTKGNTGGYPRYNVSGAANQNNGPQGNANQPKKPKKKSGTGKKFAIGIVFAACVGLVAGVVFYGVNYIGNRYIYKIVSSETADTEVKSTSASSDFEKNVDEAINGGSDTDTSVDKSTTTSSGYGTVTEVASECMPSLVTIATVSVQEMQSMFGGTQQYEAQGAGTGVIVGENDTELLIATNYHVVQEATSLSVGFVDETSVEAQVKGTDDENDLAVISVKLEDISDDTLSQIKIASIGDSDELELGDQVVAIGNAMGYGQSVTSGYVSALDRTLNLTYNNGETFTSTKLIQTDAAINAGNSGGALLNMKGELIGINEAKAGTTSYGEVSVEGMGYAIPISKALPILENLMSLPTREKVDSDNTGYLGVVCANVTSDIAESYNMPEGICVTEVVADGPADNAGIIKGDIITQIDGYDISTYDDLKEQLQYYAAGQTIDFTIMRADAGEYKENTVSVTLGTSDVLSEYNQNTQDNN